MILIYFLLKLVLPFFSVIFNSFLFGFYMVGIYIFFMSFIQSLLFVLLVFFMGFVMYFFISKSFKVCFFDLVSFIFMEFKVFYGFFSNMFLFMLSMGLFSLFLYVMLLFNKFFVILWFFDLSSFDGVMSKILPYSEYIINFYLVCGVCFMMKWFSSLFLFLCKKIYILFKNWLGIKSFKSLKSYLENLKLYYLKNFFYIHKFFIGVYWVLYYFYFVVIFFSSVIYLSFFYYEVIVNTYPDYGFISFLWSYFSFLFYMPSSTIGGEFSKIDFIYLMIYFSGFLGILKFILLDFFVAFYVIPSFKSGLFSKDVESGKLNSAEKVLHEVVFLSVLFFSFIVVPVPSFAVFVFRGCYLAKLQFFFFIFDVEMVEKFNMDLKDCNFFITAFSNFLGIFGPIITNWLLISSVYISPVKWFWKFFSVLFEYQSKFSKGLFMNMDLSHWYTRCLDLFSCCIKVSILAFFFSLFMLLIYFIWGFIISMYLGTSYYGIFWLPTEEQSAMILDVILKK